ncbi:BTB/POZ domain-containing protein 6-A, partial [Aphelenchoides avenae]
MELGKRNLHARMMHILSDTEKFDVAIVVGEEKGETFGANSLILAAASEAFEKQFYGAFERPSVEKPLVVEIPDGTPDAFRVLLTYIYTDRAVLTIDNVSSVIYLSKKYLLTNLYQLAVRFVEQHVDASTVIHFLSMSELFEELQK